MFSVVLYRQSRPTINGPPTLPIPLLTTLAQQAWQEDLNSVEVEAMVVSLIGQGFLKAYIAHARGLIVFQKAKMGFEPFASLYSD